jgi:hypothetical protein
MISLFSGKKRTCDIPIPYFRTFRQIDIESHIRIPYLLEWRDVRLTEIHEKNLKRLRYDYLYKRLRDKIIPEEERKYFSSMIDFASRDRSKQYRPFLSNNLLYGASLFVPADL